MGSSDSDPDDAGLASGTEAADASDRGRSRTAAIGVLLVLALVGSSLLLRSLTGIDPTVLVGAVGLLALLGGVLVWRRAGGSDGGGDGDGDSDVWNAIPSWQYDGRHVESGGLTRSEQESALRDIQRRADELEERERN